MNFAATVIRLAAIGLSFLAGIGMIASAQTAKTAGDPFIGKWKLDPSKSKRTDEMKVESAGGNRYGFDFGSGTEMIVADGTDQHGNFNSTLAVTVIEPRAWKVVRKKDGRTMITAIWNLSEDGNTLTDHFTSHKPDGSTSATDYVYKRTAGTLGFAGTWESVNQEMMSAFELQVQNYEASGLSFINASEGTTKNMKFDGRDYQILGSNLPQGFAFTSSGHRVNARTIELTDKIDGKIANTQHMELSSDLKSLTVTVRRGKQSKPNVLVFERE